MTGSVIVFAKEPKAGRVKTRLGRDIGMGRAAALSRVMINLTLAQASRGEWRKIIAIDPPAACSTWRSFWPDQFERIAQSKGTLGDRMAAAMEHVSNGPVVVIGVDAPGLRARHIHDAFYTLRRADAVFGPADDGGYWLIGLAGRKRAPALFDNVKWSTQYALEDTLASLPAGFETAYLPVLCDVDQGKDLKTAGPLLRSMR
jgi:rSAM/selenodomain-associated transferase 1